MKTLMKLLCGFDPRIEKETKQVHELKSGFLANMLILAISIGVKISFGHFSCLEKL